MARRLPADATEGRTKARPPDATPARRTTRTGARHAARRRRLQPPRRGDEPGAPREARGSLDAGRRMDRGRVITSEGALIPSAAQSVRFLGETALVRIVPGVHPQRHEAPLIAGGASPLTLN